MDWRESLKYRTGHFDEDESRIWHAVFVMTGDEDTVKQKIAYAFNGTEIKAVVPKRLIKERKNGIWKEKFKPLFPGYILLQGQFDTGKYYTLRTIPGIVRILKDNKGLYRIYPDEIDIINRLMCNGELIGTSTVLRNGDKIIISDGPLLGMEGLIISINGRKGRARIKLSILGNEKTIDLDIKLIDAI